MIDGMSDLKKFLARKTLERAANTVRTENNTIIGDANLTQPPTVRSASRYTSEGNPKPNPGSPQIETSAAKGINL